VSITVLATSESGLQTSGGDDGEKSLRNIRQGVLGGQFQLNNFFTNIAF